jgi:hypothetical protein
VALSSTERTRFARHLLLPEIGASGQERLCAARVRVVAGADAEAAAIARDFLERAGVSCATEGRELFVPAASEVEALAGDPLLLEAARALSGALAAVEAVKVILEIGAPLSGAPRKLSSEDV